MPMRSDAEMNSTVMS